MAEGSYAQDPANYQKSFSLLPTAIVKIKDLRRVNAALRILREDPDLMIFPEVLLNSPPPGSETLFARERKIVGCGATEATQINWAIRKGKRKGAFIATDAYARFQNNVSRLIRSTNILLRLKPTSSEDRLQWVQGLLSRIDELRQEAIYWNSQKGSRDHAAKQFLRVSWQRVKILKQYPDLAPNHS